MELPTGTVTFLFTDIEGSTKLLQQLGAGYTAVLDQHSSVIREALAEHGGVEVSTEGDAFFCVFAGAHDALHATAAIQRGLAAQDWPDGADVKIRMGLHTGEGTLGGDNYIGIDVNRAARIASAGHGGQVLISDATHSLVADSLTADVRIRDLGVHRLKDLDRPERLHQLDIDGLPSEFPPPRTLDAVRHNLPAPLTSFHGREREVAQVHEALESHRLVTLTGPGGTGKTRLAIEAARVLAPAPSDGTWFVALSAISDPELLAPTIVESLGLRYPVGTPADQVAQHFEQKDAVLVLDNFEQLLGAGPQVTAWLGECPKLRILVTSHAPLRVSGERELPVPPLGSSNRRDDRGLEAVSAEDVADDPAVQLFVDRAVAAKPGFELRGDDVATVVRITRRLDGLPLAVELAAALVKLLPPTAILERLSQSLNVLTGGPQDLPARQRSLREAMAWSYELLDERSRLLLEHLAVFVGGASYEKIEEVCAPGDPSMLFDALRTLVDQSLVTQTDVDGAARFDMLNAIRDFALERLEDRGHGDEVRQRHADAFRELAVDVERGIRSSDEARWNVAAARDFDNLRAAFMWGFERGDVDLSYTVSVSLARWALFRTRDEVARWVLDARELPGADAHALYGRASAALAWAVSFLGGVEEAEQFAQEGLSAAVLSDEGRYDLHVVMGNIRMFQGNVDDSLRHLDTAREYAADAWGRAYVFLGHCLALAYTGQTERAYLDAQTFEEQARDVGNPALIAFAKYAQGESLMQQDVEEAMRCLEESIRVASSVDGRFLVGVAQVSLASLSARHGDALEAIAAFRDLVDLWQRSGHWTQLWTTLRSVAEAFSRLGADEAAAVLFAALMENRAGAGLFGDDAARLSELSRHLSESLGIEYRATLEARGRSMSGDDVVTFVLETMDNLLASVEVAPI